jgi:hypothetical protein
MKQINKDITLWVADRIIVAVGDEREFAEESVGNYITENINQKI